MRAHMFLLVAAVAVLALPAVMCGGGEDETATTPTPVGTFVQLDRTIEYGLLSVNIKGAHIWSSRVSLYYDVLTDPGVIAEPLDPVAKLVYADGEEVFATAPGGFIQGAPGGLMEPRTTDPLANAPYALTFTLARRPEEPLAVEFGRFIVAVQDRRDYALPVDGTATVEMGGDTFELSEASDEDGNIGVRVQRVAGADPGGFLVNSVNDATLRDDLGNEYYLLHGETGFRKTEVMKPIADRNVMVFAGPLNPNAKQLYLTVPDSARVVGPAEGGRFSLP